MSFNIPGEGRQWPARTLLLFVLVLTLASWQVVAEEMDGPETGTFRDNRDGQEYRWVRIGSQVWMAENLRFVPETEWKCWNDDEEECFTKGIFYNWDTACIVAPSGWHLPSDEEWKVLERELGIPEDELDLVGLDRVNNAGSTIKKTGCWPEEHNGKPVEYSDGSGFSAVPTGFFALGEFTHSGYAGWWTSTPEGDRAWVRALGFHDNMLTRAPNARKFFFPVRCVKDVRPDPEE